MRHLFAVVLVLACLRLWSAGEPAGHAVALPTAGAAPAAGATETLMPPPAATVDDPARRFYDRIAREMLRGDCDAAIHGFHLFLELYGRTPLAPYADYWLGDCAFQLSRYDEAIISFDRVLARPAVPAKLLSAALMRKGLSYAKMGKPARSRHTLELVVTQFPETQAATAARQTLLALSKER
jgi:TolA-binding protein